MLWRYYYDQTLRSCITITSRHFGCKLLPCPPPQQSWNASSESKGIGRVLFLKGEEARGRGKRGWGGGHWREEGVCGGVSITLSALRRRRQSPTGSRSARSSPDKTTEFYPLKLGSLPPGATPEASQHPERSWEKKKKKKSESPADAPIFRVSSAERGRAASLL